MSPDELSISSEAVDAGGSEFALVAVSGEVDLGNADQLRSALAEAANGNDGVVVDLSGVPFMDSSGLQAVLISARDLAPRFSIVIKRDSAVARLIDLADVADRVANFPSRDEAIAALSSPEGDGG